MCVSAPDRARFVEAECGNRKAHFAFGLGELPIMMDEGVIVADGKTKEILADAKLLEAHGLESCRLDLGKGEDRFAVGGKKAEVDLSSFNLTRF